MGFRVMGSVWTLALFMCALHSTASAQSENQDTGAEPVTGAMVPPELAFISDEDELEEGSGAMVPAEVAVASYGADSDAADAADDTSEPDPASLDARDFYSRYRRFNTRDGATGGFHLVDPSTGMPGSFRIQLATGFFSSSDYLRARDEVDVTSHVLSLNWTATNAMELFGTLTSRSASYAIPMDLSEGSNRSQSLAVNGDLGFGMKVGSVVSGPLSLGGDARVQLYTGEGQGSPDLAAASVLLRGSASLDLRRQANPVPFIARFNLGYSIDNSAELVSKREDDRYQQVMSPRPVVDETRHLANRFERLAFGMNRVDTLGLGVGVELPLFVADDFYLHPWLEWTWGVPINRQAYDCAHVAVAGVGTTDSFEDGCLNKQGLAASPMVLSLGMRVVTPLRGFSMFGGVDIGLLGTSTFVRELAPTAPYAVLIGVAVDYDARPAQVVVVEREVRVETAAPVAVTGRVQGVVIDQSLGSPVAGASVRVVGSDRSAVQTDDGGRFTTFDLLPGEIRYAVAHPDYESGECVAVISASGGVAESRCAIAALPRKGSLKLEVVDVWGAPVAGASVQLTGPVVLSLNTNAQGIAQNDELAAGQYAVRVDAPGHYLRLASVAIAMRTASQLELTLTPRPAKSRVELRGNEIRLSGAVRFARGSSAIDASLAPVVADLADLLLRNPQLAHVRIEAPADAGGDAGLGLSRALALKQRLVDAGVEAGRLNAVAGTSSRVAVVSE